MSFAPMTYALSTQSTQAPTITASVPSEMVPPSIVMFTEARENESAHGHIRLAEDISLVCAEDKVSFAHVPVCGSNLLSKIKELREAGTIGDNTHIIITMHGVITEGQHVMDEDVATFGVIEAIREPLNGKACAAPAYIASCKAGNNVLREKLQDLHNRYGVGVCFLLSSSKDILNRCDEPALATMCEEFRDAKRAGNPHSPSPNHIFARMAAFRGDCLTMIEANRTKPLIVHAPKTGAEMGPNGLSAEINRAYVIIPEKGSNPGGVDPVEINERVPEPGKQTRKASVSGDDATLKALAEALNEEKSLVRPRQEGEYTIEDEERDQWDNALSRLADRSSIKDLNAALADYKEKYSPEETEFALKLIALLDVALTGDKKYTAEKCTNLFERIAEKKKYIVPDLSSIREIVRDAPEAFKYLVERDFFIADLRDGSKASATDRIRFICNGFAKIASAEEIDKVLHASDAWMKDFRSKEWNDSHGLIIEMLQNIASDQDEKRHDGKCDYLSGILTITKNAFDSYPERELLVASLKMSGRAYRLLDEKGFFKVSNKRPFSAI